MIGLVNHFCIIFLWRQLRIKCSWTVLVSNNILPVCIRTVQMIHYASTAKTKPLQPYYKVWVLSKAVICIHNGCEISWYAISCESCSNFFIRKSMWVAKKEHKTNKPTLMYPCEYKWNYIRFRMCMLCWFCLQDHQM